MVAPAAKGRIRLIVLVRFACVFWWIAALIAGAQAVEGRDWHMLVVQIAESLIALVLWFSVESDSDRLRAPRFGTRGLRLALYAITFSLGIAAFFSWRWPFRSAATSLSDFGVILLGILVTGRFLSVEWRRQRTS